jgi:pyruvate dehydrogenase E2 component (dihydrolipoamide acetyltransferase)
VADLEFRLPDVGEGIATADILAWRVAEGDRVAEDQDLVEIQTDKAIVVIPCPATGVVRRLCAAEGDSLGVGELLAIFADSADDLGQSPRTSVGSSAIADDLGQSPRTSVGSSAIGLRPMGNSQRAGDSPGAPVGPAGRPLAAPATRRLARELGVDLGAVAGSGPHGRIVREDVERAAAPAPPPAAGPCASAPAAPVPGEVVPLRGVRRAIARALTKAWLEVPRIIDYREVDASALVAVRARLKQRALDRGDAELAAALTPTPLIVKAALRALRDHPYVNASIDLEREEITLHRHCHVGIATAGPDGLVVPVVHDAGDLSLAGVAREVAALSRAAHERRLRPEQLAGATFTVNNYGGLGIWLGTPIVRPPEVVNLGVGAIRDQVVAVGGAPVVRPTLALAVAGDHRVLDGHTLGAFVTQVAALLEDPLALLEEALGPQGDLG